MKIISVNKENFEEEVLKCDVPVLVDFNANWCGPCKMLRPILDEIAKSSDDYKIVSINVDEEEELSEKYEVYSIPCLVFINNGKETKRAIGLRSKDEILELLGEK